MGKELNANSNSDPVTFTEPTDAKEKGKYILVFKGTLGNETDDAVVGRVVTLESGIWEDWESGFTGKHQWKGYNGSFEVVDGFGDNDSKVLKILGTGDYSSIYTSLEKSSPIPKKMSFDYYIKSLGSYGAFFLRIYGKSGGKSYMRDLYVYVSFNWICLCGSGCNQYYSKYSTWKWCAFTSKSGDWEHVEAEIADNGEISAVTFIVDGDGFTEVYIDNIDFEWETAQ